MKIVGLMSGTSADGVDAALVDVEDGGGRRKVTTLAWITVPFSSAEREDILATCDPFTGTVDRICRLNMVLGEQLSEAARAVVNTAGLTFLDVDLIASHGQTVYHAVGPFEEVRSTLQIGSPAVIAERTGRTVVADFRGRDVAAGGQGAPLASYVDYLLFTDPLRFRALQNIGGIGNVTLLPAAGAGSTVTAFDTGPGNMVIDALARELFRLPFDRDGAIARSARVDEGLLAAYLEDPYYALPPPKTTGREQFGAAFARRFRADGESRGLSAADLIASATALTARTVAGSYARFAPLVEEVVLSGGGASNPTLVEWLADAMRSLGLSTAIRTTDDFGIATDAKEAIVFAILGYETINGRPGTLPSCTGASRPVVLGSITPGDNYLDLMARVALDRGGS